VSRSSGGACGCSSPSRDRGERRRSGRWPRHSARSSGVRGCPPAPCACAAETHPAGTAHAASMPCGRGHSRKTCRRSEGQPGRSRRRSPSPRSTPGASSVGWPAGAGSSSTRRGGGRASPIR
jgi:hypothetical protein